MGKGSKSGASHQLFKDKADNRVDDLQGMFSDLQLARKESRMIDVAVIEEQIHHSSDGWVCPQPTMQGNRTMEVYCTRDSTFRPNITITLGEEFSPRQRGDLTIMYDVTRTW